jgi:hypothetical protein
MLLSVPNKISNLPKEKGFLNCMSINVKKMDDIKQVMKYIEHDHQEFWTAVLAALETAC